MVDAAAAGDAAVYGVNTGFGNFAETRIDKADLAALQVNLLRSHAAGVDAPLPVRAVRASMALRANVLAKGFSGIRVETLEALLAMLNRGVHPRVPSRGSVGASGDLAPLAHLALVLIGEGERAGRAAPGRRRSARRASRRSRSRPRKVSRSSTARRSRPRCSRWRWPAPSGSAARRTSTAALSIDALMGSLHPFEPRIHAPRPFAGQAVAADNLLRLLDRQRHQRVARQLRARAGRVLACAARRRCTAPRAKRSLGSATSSRSR